MTAYPLLSGNSGATLRILPTKGQAIVRKSSPTEEGNSRLMRQMEKQLSFSALGTPIRTPEILQSGIDDGGRFYFDMEFVAGLDGHKFLERCSPADLRGFTRKLSEHLAIINQLPVIGKTSAYPTLFDACVYKLIEIHHRNVGLSNEHVGRILNSLEQVRRLEISAQAFCHGDFTLENIMINTRGELMFVDFLDSAFEHPLQDLVKLSQDIHGGWFRMKGRRISGAFIAYLDQMLGEAADQVFPEYELIRKVLQALNFARILPYVNSESERQFVIAQISKFST